MLGLAVFCESDAWIVWEFRFWGYVSLFCLALLRGLLGFWFLACLGWSLLGRLFWVDDELRFGGRLRSVALLSIRLSLTLLSGRRVD